MRIPFLLFVVSLAFTLSACSHAVREAPAKSGTASFKVFIPQDAPRFDLPKNQGIVLGPALDQAEPVYPQELLAKEMPPQSVCLSVAIDTEGVVYMAYPLYGLPGCPADAQAVNQAFVAASRRAALAWRFLPALLCTFKPGVDANAPSSACPSDAVTSQPIAISLAFVFTFTQTNGKPGVHVGRLHQQP